MDHNKILDLSHLDKIFILGYMAEYDPVLFDHALAGLKRSKEEEGIKNAT